MILACGLALWLLTAITILKLYTLTSTICLISRFQIILLLLLFTVGGILYFRPHLEMFGGEDAGAYLNAAVTFAREGTLFPVDPLLSQVTEPVRPLFFYNVGIYGQTKDGVLWIKNLEEARLRPHFQPAYPILMSFIATIMPNKFILYVAPLFTLFAAFALWALGTLLFRTNWAGLTSATFFLANPVTAWHGRCARAETPAVFFLLAGLFFLLYAWKNRDSKQLPAILLGSTCIFISSFFHILTWMAILPLSLCLFFIMLNGRKDFLAFFACFIMAIFFFLLQTIFVTDAYFLGESLGKIANTLTGSLLFALLAVLGIFSLIIAKYHLIKSYIASYGIVSLRWLSIIAMTASLCGFVYVVFLGEVYPIKGWLQPYLRWTDFEGLRNLLSRPVLLLALFGGFLLVLREGRGGQNERVLLWILLLPGILLMGWVENYMLDNRRFLLFLVPLMALSLTALMIFLHERTPGKAYAACAGMVLILGLTIQNRTHLYTLQEYKGLLNFFAPYAQIVKENNGILLFEYTRFGAIFDHFFGIPTLSLNNEIHPDYTFAEKAWHDIMLANPERPAFFATPFQTPQSEFFFFSPVRHDHYSGSALKQERRRLPTQINTHTFGLNLYRMSLSQDDTHPFPFYAQINAGNMGLTRFANMRREHLPMNGVILPSGEQLALPVQLPDKSVPPELLLILHDSGPNSGILPDIKIENGNTEIRPDLMPIAPDWWLARILFTDAQHEDLIILRVQSDLVLTSLKGIKNERVHDFDLMALPGATGVVFPFIQARWARNNASMILPLPGRESDIFILMTGRGSEDVRELHLRDGQHLLHSLQLPPDTWSWHILRLPSDYALKDRLRLTFRVHAPWNPGLPNFPSDLAVLIGHVGVVPR